MAKLRKSNLIMSIKKDILISNNIRYYVNKYFKKFFC